MTEIVDSPPGRYRLGHRGTVRDLRDELTDAGWTVRVVDGAAMPDRAGLLDEFATAGDFPDWFGGNWDALADCLRDLSWLPDRPLAILWLRAGVVAPNLAATAGQVIDAAIADRVEAGRPGLYLLYPPTPTSPDVLTPL